MTLLQWYAMVSMCYQHMAGTPMPIKVLYEALIAETYLSGDQTCFDVAESIYINEYIVSVLS